MARRHLRPVALGALLVLSLAALAIGLGRNRAPVTITLDPAKTFQTFHGWEGTAVLLGSDEEQARADDFLDALDRDIGLTRLRVGVFSGDENRTRSMQRFLAGEIDMDGWRQLRFATVNDDADPFHINPEGFDFYDLDWKMEHTVLPLMARAKARGARIEINLNYVAFTKQSGADRAYLHTDPEEYAEFILAAFLHLREKYGVVPDYFEPLLEPDNSPHWDPVALGRAISAAVRRLDGAGFRPGLILPSVSDASLTFEWLDGILQSPGIADHLAEVSYHRYAGADASVLSAIAKRADELGTSTAMLEYWFGNATYEVLHQDLTVANVSAWQPRATFSFHKIGPDGALVLNDDIRLDRPYFAAIRPDDVRISAQSDAPRRIDPVAFSKPDGGLSLVLKSSGPAQVILTGLPPGTYAEEWALAAGGDGRDVRTVGADGRMEVQIAGRGVLALYPTAP